MAVLCGMPTIQYSARSAWLYVRLCKWACPKIISGQSSHKARRRRIDGWFNAIRQVTATCPSIRAHSRHLANTIEVVHPSAHSSPQSKRQMERFSRFCTVSILYNGRPYPPELPLPMGDLDLPCNTLCFRPMGAHNPNGTSIGSAVFAQMTAECLYSLQWFVCSPSKLPLPMLASGPHIVIRGSFGPPESGTQMVT